MALFYKSIGFKLFATLFVFFIILLSAGSLAFYSQSESMFRDQMLTSLSETASLQELRVNDAVESEIDEVRLFASRVLLLTNLRSYFQGQTSTKANITEILSALFSPQDENIFLLSKNGDTYLQANDTIPLSSTAQRIFYEKGSSEITLFIHDFGYGPHIYVCGPLILKGENLGVVVMEKNVATLAHIVEEGVSKYKSEETVLAFRGISGEAIFISKLKFGNATSGVIPLEKANVPISQALNGIETTLINNPDYRGVLVLAATRYIASADLGLVTKVDVSEAYAPIYQLQGNFIIIALIVIPIILAISYIFSRSVSLPLSKLTTEVAKVTKGELNISKVVERDDEIGVLQTNILEMAEHLRLSFEQIEGKNRELDRLNKELAAFSYSVSHDLRAPLRSIDGFSKVLLEDYDRSLDETGREHLHRVRAASQKMGKLIDDLLSLSRIGGMEMVNREIDLSKIAHSIADELMQREPDRKVDWRIQEGLLVRGDEALLRIVLYNLLENSWKFTSKKEKATIEVGATEVNGEKAFFVRDDGAGFDMQYAHKLFTPFQRLHSGVDFPGTGIGLSIVQRVISRHGGRVWAVGEEGKGATFYFTITI